MCLDGEEVEYGNKPAWMLVDFPVRHLDMGRLSLDYATLIVVSAVVEFHPSRWAKFQTLMPRMGITKP